MPEFPDDSWLELQNLFTIRHLRKGDFISKAGEVVKNVSFIKEGLGRFYYNVDGKESISGFFVTGDYVSDYASFITQTPSHLYVEVMSDSTIIDLSYENMQIAYKRFPEFQKFGRLIAEYLYIMVSDRTATLLLKSPEQRYLDFMKNSAYLVQLVPQYMIASYLGVTPEALSRIRKRIAK
jgi:CRP-like cAMP-binding protein